ncbi:hypothetical protein [Blastococcus sp. SYSU D00820]
MLLWPAVALLGFLATACLVIALGRRSTARYEFERNRVPAAQQPAAAAVPAAAGAAAVPSGAPRAAGGSAAPQAERRPQGSAVGLATHPAGKRSGDPSPGEHAWWLLDETAVAIVAGPYADRVEAEWAALASGVDAQPVYGVQRGDGTWVRRQTPQERAWLSALGDQLDRLGEDWDDLLTDDDALTTLVVEVAAALVEAGLTLHDCAGREDTVAGTGGGVCLTPDPQLRGVLVSWQQHDRMTRQLVRGAEVHAAVQRSMTGAVAGVLADMGFAVEPFGATGCAIVTAAPR